MRVCSETDAVSVGWLSIIVLMAVSAATAYYQQRQLHARAAIESMPQVSCRMSRHVKGARMRHTLKATITTSVLYPVMSLLPIHGELSDLQHCVKKLTALFLQMSLAIQICAIYGHSDGP